MAASKVVSGHNLADNNAARRAAPTVESRAGAGSGSLERNKARKSLAPERGAEEQRAGVLLDFFDGTSIFVLII